MTVPVALSWPTLADPIYEDAIIDTGCPVDFVASPKLSERLRTGLRPQRPDTIDWGGRVDCEVYPVLARLAVWMELEVYVPLDEEFDSLLGLPAILDSNICIRGPSRSFYWAYHDQSSDVAGFFLRDSGPDEAYRPGPSGSGAGRRKDDDAAKRRMGGRRRRRASS